MNVEQFRVVLLEVMSMINDRPLGPIDWDKEQMSDVVFVTPNQLVHGRNSRILPVGMKDISAEDQDVTELYRTRTKVLRMFFREFMTHYQRTLKFSDRFFEKMDGDIPVGTMVLVRDGTFKTGKYAVARVTNVHRRADGKISRLEIQTTEHKHPVFRDLRQISMLEHDYLNLISPAHRCLIKGLEEDAEIPIPAALLTFLCN